MVNIYLFILETETPVRYSAVDLSVNEKGKSMGVQQVPDRVSGFGFSLIFNGKRRFLSVPTGNQESSFSS